MAKALEPTVRLRIEVDAPVPGVTLRLQRGRDELVEPVKTSAKRLTFECTARVGVRNGQPNFLGEFVQGPVDGRFIYVNAGTYAGQADSPVGRRAKVPLAGITRRMIDRALRDGGVLAATIYGTGRDGGPCAGTVDLLDDGWRIEPAE